uniref:Uncharacterized protein n=1 Tax=Cacopsylla melanoneura TaxID=428564 RepID=A0A8D9E8Z3_9HEMI
MTSQRQMDVKSVQASISFKRFRMILSSHSSTVLLEHSIALLVGLHSLTTPLISTSLPPFVCIVGSPNSTQRLTLVKIIFLFVSMSFMLSFIGNFRSSVIWFLIISRPSLLIL